MLENIPDRHTGCEAERPQGDGFHRWRGQQRSGRCVFGQPTAQPRQLGTAPDRDDTIEFAQIAAVATPAGECCLQQLLQCVAQSTLFQQSFQLAPGQAQPLRAALDHLLFEFGLLRQLGIAEATFQPLGPIEQRWAQRLIRTAAGSDPAIDVAAAQPQAGLAEDVGIAQPLFAAVSKLTPTQPQQLSDGCGLALPTLQGHQGQIQGAAAEIHHQHPGPGWQAGPEGRGRWFIHKRQLLHR